MTKRRRDMRAVLPPLSRVPTPVWIALGAAAALLALAGFVLIVEGVKAKSALLAASTQTQTLQQQLADGESGAAPTTLRSLARNTDRARRHTDGPLWATASFVPFLGDDARAVNVAAASVDRIVDRAVPPVVEAASSLNAKAFSPRNGRIDIERLATLAPVAAEASGVLNEERKQIDSINASNLVGPLARPIRELQDKVGTAESSAHAAAVATKLTPDLLGASQPRRYLLVFQNNAEIRSTGGLNGAYVILTANDGRLTIDEPGSNSDLLGDIEEPVLRLTKDERLVFPTAMGTDFRNTGFTPDFPRSAQLARAIVKRKLDTDVHGVLSMDPVALSYVLRGTGPITLADGTRLTSDNAVRVLLNEVYVRIPEPRLQDAYFASATQRIFEQAMTGEGDPTEVIRALAQGVSERRVMFWSARKSEQTQLAGTALANELPSTPDSPQFGVYLTDTTLAKMQYYLDFKTALDATDCSTQGVQTLVSTTTLTSRAPADAANLPKYIAGNSGKVPSGDQVLIVRLYGSSGGAFTEVTLDGREQQLYGLQHHGRPVTYVVVKLKPGQTSELVSTSVTGRRQGGDGMLLTTPGIAAFRNAVPVRSACG